MVELLQSESRDTVSPAALRVLVCAAEHKLETSFNGW